MFRRKLFASVAGLSGLAIAITGIALTPVTATAVDPCTISVTKGGLVPTYGANGDVEVTNYSIYCVAKFRTVANDYRFTVPAGITKIDYLVVGGGGGGASGGGGAGGVLMANDYSVTPGQAISVSVGRGGDGGTGGNGTSSLATKGADSSFAAITALGGGAGGANGVSGTIFNGASGGGSRFDCTSSNCGQGIAGTSVAGQGNNGGYSTYNSYGAGGGGGGAGGAGLNTTRNYIGGKGGIGLASDITGTSTYYGGGGGGGINNNHCQYVGVDENENLTFHSTTPSVNGGGPGGLGGGGRGSSWGYSCGTRGVMANATAGEPNTGGGGGGTDPEDIGAGAGGSGVVIVRWVSNVNLKTITFNSNVTPAQTASQVVGSGVATPLTPSSFARSGYVFMGWTAAQDGTGTLYADGDSFTTAADVTLYAKWAAGVTNTLTFNANGGTGTMANQTAGTSTAVTPNAFTRSNFTFIGWNTAANGSGFAYADGAIYSFQEDTTFYAQWQAVVPTYRVTFYGNGAGGGTTASQSASSSTPLNLNGFTRTGYNFLGWNTNYSSGSATYRDGQNYAFTSDVSLYAIWVIQANNNLVYDGNSSTGGSTASQTASSNTLLRANGFTRTGYTFINWNTAADGAGVSYESNYVYSFAAGLTLYAQWGENISISYDANTSDSGTTPTTQSTYVGSPGINLPLNSGNLRKAGYRLAGWNANSGGTGTPYALGASSIKFSATRVLYAQWTPAVYSVVYAPNGAASGTEPSKVTFTFGSTLTVARNTGLLEKPGFDFGGWSTAADGSGSKFEPEATNVSLTTDTVLFAVWVSRASVPQTSFEVVPITPPAVNIKPVVIVKPVTSSLGGFKGNSTTLTQSMKSAMKRLYSANSKFDTVVVSGFTTGSTKIKANAAIAKARAAKAAAYLKSIGFKGKLSSVTGKQTSSPSTRSGSVQIRFSNQPVK
jgi:uncharacterized repeat protein (TIGR02543 family)